MGPSFLEALDGASRDALHEVGTVRRFAAGLPLLVQADDDDGVLVLLGGHVKLTVPTQVGREVILAVRGPGDLVGELAALDGGRRTASAVALEAVEALTLSGTAFRRFVTERPPVAHALHRLLADRLREAVRRQVEAGEHDATGRVAARLVELALAHGREAEDGIRIDLPLSQEELGSWTGASREAVARALRTLRGAGWVATGRRQVVVRDLEALRHRAGV
jgi:CRP/FNR family transcriptional regulator, cyclic AMP receptor protein